MQIDGKKVAMIAVSAQAPVGSTFNLAETLKFPYDMMLMQLRLLTNNALVPAGARIKFYVAGQLEADLDALGLATQPHPFPKPFPISKFSVLKVEADLPMVGMTLLLSGVGAMETAG